MDDKKHWDDVPEGFGPGYSAQMVTNRELGGEAAALVGESDESMVASMRSKRNRVELEQRRREERAVDQLMGVFMAFDEDGDQLLSPEELATALLSLGLDPNVEVVQKFLSRSLDEFGVDMDTFLHVCMTELEDAKTTEQSIGELMAEFDPDHTGKVPEGILRHLLQDVSTPSALSPEETATVLRMLGHLPHSTADSAVEDAKRLPYTDTPGVDITEFLAKMAYNPTKAVKK